MKKIYAIKEILLYSLILTLFIVMDIILLLNNNIIIFVLGLCSAIFSIALIIKIFAVPNHITIIDNTIKVFDYPFWATNTFFAKKRNLILWNNNIDISEIENVEIVRLNALEKERYIGYKHLLNSYIKVKLKESNSCKYIYIGGYSKTQINKIIKKLMCLANV